MPKKVRSKNQPKIIVPNARQLHDQWKQDFFLLPGWNYYDPSEPTRKDGLSKKELKEIYKEDKTVKNELIKLCKKFDCILIVKNNSYRVLKNGSLAPSVAEKIVAAINEYTKQPISDEDSLRGFRLYMHENRTKGKGKVIPSFVAEFILVGFNLHRQKKQYGKELTERELMKEFFSPKGEFFIWYRKKFENYTALTSVLCSNIGSDLLSWTKQFKNKLRENIYYTDESSSKRNTTKLKQSVEEKSQRIIQRVSETIKIY